MVEGCFIFFVSLPLSFPALLGCVVSVGALFLFTFRLFLPYSAFPYLLSFAMFSGRTSY
ncbi:hypothetical protein BDZ97DRAFT_1833240 [Flammula alnicola]|nr:hypothetical protein BDZ97DRAFT_1833240 [Flammula alnicola]